MATMGVAQARVRRGLLKSSKGRYRNRRPDRCVSRCKRAAFATAIRSTKEGLFPGIQYPRVPGHEVPGVIDAVGAGAAGWEPGQRVGVGWNGGYCGHCVDPPDGSSVQTLSALHGRNSSSFVPFSVH